MPTVGKRTFPYDKKGEAAAANFAAQTGQKETIKKKRVPKKPPRRMK